MKTSTLSTILSAWAIVAQVQAAGLAGSNCTSTSTLPPITISTPPGGNEPPIQVYTVTYSEFCSTGLTPKVYTITESCQQTQCQPHAGNTPPSDFTSAEVVCQTCNSGEPLTETLTYPVNSATALSQSGYIINHSPAEPTPYQTQPTPAQPTSGGSETAALGESGIGNSDTTGAPTTVPTAGASILLRDYLSGTVACVLGLAVLML